jgi:uncharacterized protein YndB with AHSA1/START domain
MKTVKIVLGILVVLTVVFFGTGLVIKESQYTVEANINKPIEETFQLFNNQEKISQWMPEIKNIETIEKKPGITGSEYRVTVDNNGEVVSMKEKVLAYVPNEKVTLFIDAENVLKTDDYTFVKEGDQTKIILNATYEAESYILACVFPYFKGKFKEVDENSLNNFKEFAEQQ